MGTPPTQQVGVLGSDVFAWIRCGAAEEPHKEYVFTLETAVRVCVQIADDPEIPAYHAARARTLAGWLEAQRAA